MAESSPVSARLTQLGVRPEDLRESFVRASGPGGQNVNKVATCVQLLHLPTGITVKCMVSRSQAQNRTQAHALLADRLEARAEADRLRQAAAVSKQRRQRAKRSRGTKRQLVEGKRRRAVVKQGRGRVRDE
jgi:protein subunit release factor B